MADYTFRLKDTPLGTLVVKFYQVEPYSQEAFERLVQRDFLAATIPGSGGSWGSRLYGVLVTTGRKITLRPKAL